MRSTGEKLSNPVVAKRRFPEAEITSFALSAPPPHGASLRAFFEAVRHQIGIDSVELTLIGLLRHSKRFFGLPVAWMELFPIVTNAAMRQAHAEYQKSRGALR